MHVSQVNICQRLAFSLSNLPMKEKKGYICPMFLVFANDGNCRCLLLTTKIIF